MTSQVDVREIDLTTKILGYITSLPVYITATALGRLAHPDGNDVTISAMTPLTPSTTTSLFLL